MPVIQWSTDFELDQTVMDDTHREFVDCLNRLADAAGDDLPARLDDFIAHTEAHFAQEDRWMEELEFPPIGCHVGEHANVLEVARRISLEGPVHTAFNASFVGSIGPTCSEALRARGVRVDLEPSKPRMGVLVEETARAYRDARPQQS